MIGRNVSNFITANYYINTHAIKRFDINLFVNFNREKQIKLSYMNCKKYTIKGKYSVLVDPRQTIIQCEPHSEEILYKNFKEFFSKYKALVEFEYLGEEPYPMIIDEDVLEVFLDKNDSIKYLIDKFNLTT